MRNRPNPTERRESRELENLLIRGEVERARQRALELSRQREERAKQFSDHSNQPR